MLSLWTTWAYFHSVPTHRQQHKLRAPKPYQCCSRTCSTKNLVLYVHFSPFSSEKFKKPLRATFLLKNLDICGEQTCIPRTCVTMYLHSLCGIKNWNNIIYMQIANWIMHLSAKVFSNLKLWENLNNYLYFNFGFYCKIIFIPKFLVIYFISFILSIKLYHSSIMFIFIFIFIFFI